MIYLLLFLLVIISGFSFFLFKDEEGKKIKLLLSFSGAYLLAISFLHLIPEIYGCADNRFIGFFVLAGFFLQILLEYFSKGIEHGHVHLHNHGDHKHAFPLAVVASLCVHSFLEGMPLAKVVNAGEYFNKLLIGISLHNIPISIVLMSLLIKAVSRAGAFFWLIIFALMLPLGAAANYFLEKNIGTVISNYNNVILAVVVGIFLHISTTILFESTENHRFNLLKFISILLGAGFAIIQW